MRSSRVVQANDRKRLCYQVYLYFLTYFAYCCFHNTRECWSYIKEYVENDTGWSTGDVGLIDACFLFAYSAGLYIAGVLGDNFNIRRILTITYAGVCIFMYFIGFGYELGVHGLWYFCIFFALNGLFQSSGLPMLVAVMGNWFGRRGRGFVLGLWTSC